MDSSKSTEDDTIRDSMEQGYVAARPRFTRVRDTWKVNVRNLVSEDKRALDYFLKEKAKRGGNAFLIPNLLPNASFEFPAVSAGEVVQGWNLSLPAPQEAVAVTAVTVEDGTQAVQFGTVNGATLAGNSSAEAWLQRNQAVPCNPGETYILVAQMQIAPGSLASGVMIPELAVDFFDADGNPVNPAAATNLPVNQTGWNAQSLQFTIPANATSFQPRLCVALNNASGAPITFDGTASVFFDDAGCALLTPVQAYGRMMGSEPLGKLVRFTRLPEFADIGWGGGVKRYGATFEVTEI